MRRIGVLMSGDENDPEQKRRVTAFTQALADLGWTDGRNVSMDVHWGTGDINRMRALVQEAAVILEDGRGIRSRRMVAESPYLAGFCAGRR